MSDYRHPGIANTSPKPSTCRKCKRHTNICWVWGEATVLDPTPLTLSGEAAALVKGVPTYHVGVLRDSHVYRRRASHIEKGYPQYGHIYAAHQCDTVWEDTLFTENTWGTSLIDTREIFPYDRSEHPPY